MALAETDLADLVYDAILETGAPERFVQALSALVDRPLGISDRTLGGPTPMFRQWWVGLPAAFDRAYVSEYHKSDPWVVHAEMFELGKLRDGREVVPDADLHRTRFYQELCRPFAIGGITVGVVLRSGDRLVAISAMHPDGEGSSEEFRRVVAPLMPHLRRAFALRAQMDGDASARELVARFATPALLVDENGSVQSANAAATVALSSRQLPMFEPARRAELKASLNACVRRGPTELVARHGVNRGQLLLLDRVPGHGQRKLVLVRVVDPSTPPSHDVVGATLRRVYGLTTEEIDVALQIAAGRTPKEVAEATSATTNSVHLQLRRIFEKTGTHRQAGLVRLLERLSSLRRS